MRKAKTRVGKRKECNKMNFLVCGLLTMTLILPSFLLHEDQGRELKRGEGKEREEREGEGRPRGSNRRREDRTGMKGRLVLPNVPPLLTQPGSFYLLNESLRLHRQREEEPVRGTRNRR